MKGSPYRSEELHGDNRYEEVLAMRKTLQSRLEIEEQMQVTHDVFNAMMSREFHA